MKPAASSSELPVDSDRFGNLALPGLQEISLPDPVPWIPQTPGWYLLAAAMLVLLSFSLLRRWQRWRRNWYRRAALAKLNTMARESDSPPGEEPARLLKWTALQAFPRTDIAALSGEPWLAFLKTHSRETIFTPATEQYLQSGQYRQHPAINPDGWQQLSGDIANWVREHRAPAPGRPPGKGHV